MLFVLYTSRESFLLFAFSVADVCQGSGNRREVAMIHAG